MARKPKAFNTYIFSALRRIFGWYPEKRVALEKARVSGLGLYQCASCKRLTNKTSVQVDHKECVINPAKGFEDWNTYHARLFCSAENLEVLCKSCHQKKSRLENAERKRVKAERKKLEAKA